MIVIPAQAGIQSFDRLERMQWPWIPACAGMTIYLALVTPTIRFSTLSRYDRSHVSRFRAIFEVVRPT